MTRLADLLAQEFIQRALVGGLLAGLCAGFVGTWVLLRGLSLVTESLSHAMFPGIATGIVLFGFSPIAIAVGGVTSAILVAGGAAFIAAASRIKSDAAFAILYTAAYALGMVIVSVGRVRIEIEHLLFGHIFSLGNRDLWLLWTVAIIVVPVLIALHRPLVLSVFDSPVARSQGIPTHLLDALLVLSVVVVATACFQVAGVVPIVALIIAPPAIMRLLTNRVSMMIVGSTLIAIAATLAGVIAACLLNHVSAGAMIASLLGILFLATFFVRR
jgi:manganese transport system permease protein